MQPYKGWYYKTGLTNQPLWSLLAIQAKTLILLPSRWGILSGRSRVSAKTKAKAMTQINFPSYIDSFTVRIANIRSTALENLQVVQPHSLVPRYDPAQPSFTYHEPPISQVLVLGTFLYLLNLFGWGGQKLLGAGLLGQILLGVIYGTPLAGWLEGAWQEALVAIGYVGLLIVVFEGGMNSSISNLTALLPLSICIALTGLLLPIGLSFILHPLADFSYLHCFAAGSALASTSLGTTLAVLNPQSIGFDLRQTRLGTALLSAAVMDDVVAFILAKLLGAIGNNPNAGGAVLGKEIGRTIGVTIGIGLVSLLGTVYVLKPIYATMVRKQAVWEGRSWGGEPFLLWWMFLLWLGLVGASGYAGTSPLFGAYLAGLIIAYLADSVQPEILSPIPPANNTSHLYRSSTYPMSGNTFNQSPATSISGLATSPSPLISAFEHYITQPLMLLLLPIFFASIGYSIPFVPLWRGSVIWRGIIYAILMTLGKIGCGVWLVIWTRDTRGWKGGVVLGLAMVARGEIGLLISQIAYTTPNPLLLEDEFLIVTWGIVLCTIAGPVGVGFFIRHWGKSIVDGGWN